MRTIRLRRVAVLAFAALGLLGATAPSANAATAVVVAFQGTATLGSGLSYPCFPADLANCPTTGSVTVNPNTTEPIKSVQVNDSSPTAVNNFSSGVCVGAGVVNDQPAAGLGCSIQADGTVSGWCGLSSGLVDFEITVPVLPSGSLTLTGRAHWIGVGGTLVLTGTASGGVTIAGVVQAVPVPTPTGTTLGNSCSAGTAAQFEIAGAVLAAGV